ncbi:sigma-54 interaction domain-containing protein [Desulfobacula toluolica]|uniref:Transcriptional regulator, sigma54-dependent n=1 Tax=Desulfobacula toluolica (strain DSM 7467 / Tol2) TaxID=651182 RepID=K0NIN8_DESTT|nr:sigma 54-interacting transcriptional regulator [Desulfobacula toluolica]CCK80795.1 transcriptional regulator, sigma54-dependent [Desulfobacula toluolica Tol2]
MTINDKEFFHKASKLICGNLDAKNMLTDIRKYLENFMPAQTLDLNTYEPENRILSNIASASFYSETPSYYPVKLSKEAALFVEKGHYGPVVSMINRSEMQPVAKQFELKAKQSPLCFLLLHLKVAGKRLGELVISARGQDLFSKEHAHLLELLHDPFAIAIANILKHQEVLRLQKKLSDDYRYLASELRQISGTEIIGEEYGLKPIMEMVRQVAPLNSHVLLLGETGVGKEVIANAIHYSSLRHSGPFIKVNCGALPENLVDSELFGHEKGAYTGAGTARRGRFERAHGGTIFLDEIGDLPLSAQTRLLRVMQDKTIERVGGRDPIKVDIRIISATHRDLQQMVLEKSFREDLWFRLNVFPITIPPLRHRKADIPDLVKHFVQKKCQEIRIPVHPTISSIQIKKLIEHDWPGNVRELENSVERALIHALAGTPNGGLIFDGIGRPHRQSHPLCPSLEQDVLTLDEVMWNHIENVLLLCNNRINGPNGAACRLGVNPSTLRHRMRKLGITFGKRKEVTGN